MSRRAAPGVGPRRTAGFTNDDAQSPRPNQAVRQEQQPRPLYNPIEELAAATRRHSRGTYAVCGACFGPLGELEGRYDFTKCDACQAKELELHDRAQKFGLYAYHAHGGEWRLSWLEPDAPYPDCCVDFLSGSATRIAAFLDTLEGKERAP